MANTPRILLATAMTFALTTGATSVVLAQTADSSNDRVMTTTTDRDSGFNYGWLGLIGLIGLTGLKRREDDQKTITHTVR